MQGWGVTSLLILLLLVLQAQEVGAAPCRQRGTDVPVADGLATPQPALVRKHHGNPSDTAGHKGFLGYQLASGADTQGRLMLAGVNQGRAFPASQFAWHRKDVPLADGLGTPQPALVQKYHDNPSDTAGRKGFLGYQLASGTDTQGRLMVAGVNTGRAFPASQLTWRHKGHQRAKPKAGVQKASQHPSIVNDGAGVSTGRAFPAPHVGPEPQLTWHRKGPQETRPKVLRRKSSQHKSVLNQVLEELDKVEHDLSHDTGETVAFQKRGDQVVPIYDEGTWTMKSRGMPELPNPGEARQAGINGLLDKIPGWSTKNKNNTTDTATYKNHCLEAVVGVLGSILFGIVLFCACWLCKRRIQKCREAKAKAAGNAA